MKALRGIEHRTIGALVVCSILSIVGVARAQTTLGQACEVDADCGGVPFECIAAGSSRFLGGGPAGGICSLDCSRDGQALCEPLAAECVAAADSSSSAVDAGMDVDAGATGAWCLPTCNTGVSDSNKCGGRSDMACTASSSGLGVCIPACPNDDVCGEGRRCDLGTGVCRDDLDTTTLASVGAQCGFTSRTPECDGSCLELAEGFSMCTGLCTLGVAGCGVTEAVSASQPSPVYCLLPGMADFVEGDVGYCLQTCDCNSECRHPGAVCVDFGPVAFETTGHRGACLPSDMAAYTGISCVDDVPTEPTPASPVSASDEQQAGSCACDITAHHGRPNASSFVLCFGATLLRRRARRT